MATSKARDTETGFEKAIDRVRDNVKGFAASAGETAAGGVGSVVDYGADGLKSVAHKVPQVEDWADSQIEQARDAVREQPLKMMAIAAGVGALFGLFFLRR
ncbi:hypothetical protein sos41_39830 [Alphaproteobacteria bacterium SO-S41]|nr:hypothetical protein sos41_39830 [Alphaproteobacteria bacterium SO-S41]